MRLKLAIHQDHSGGLPVISRFASEGMGVGRVMEKTNAYWAPSLCCLVIASVTIAKIILHHKPSQSQGLKPRSIF